MPHGITLQSQSPGAAGADLGFRLATLVNGQPMAMRERELGLLVEAIAANRFTLPRNEKTRARHTEKGTAIVEMHGILIDRYPYLGSFWGLSSYEGLAEQFRRLATNADIKRVVLDIDSPGGMVAGIRGCADELAKLAEKKPVFAIAHNMACSAGYWIGCIAEELSVTPDGEVGSIGVRAGHVSYAEALDREGIQFTIFKAGATKADLTPYALLSPGAAADEQLAIDRDYERFCQHVAEHRPMTSDEARDTDARTFVGERAVEAKLADRVETLEELIERVEKGAGKARPKRKAKDDPSATAARPERRPEREPAVPDSEPAAGAPRKQGSKRMTHDVTAAERDDLVSRVTEAVAGLQKKITSAPAPAAQAASQPTAEQAVAEAVAAERTRIFAVLESDAGKSRPKMAVAIAKAGLPSEASIAILAAAAEEVAAKPTASDETSGKLASALERQIAKSGNTAGIKPESQGAGANKSFAELCDERAKKKG